MTFSWQHAASWRIETITHSGSELDSRSSGSVAGSTPSQSVSGPLACGMHMLAVSTSRLAHKIKPVQIQWQWINCGHNLAWLISGIGNYLSTNLITALAGLNMHYLSHRGSRRCFSLGFLRLLFASMPESKFINKEVPYHTRNQYVAAEILKTVIWLVACRTTFYKKVNYVKYIGLFLLLLQLYKTRILNDMYYRSFLCNYYSLDCALILTSARLRNNRKKAICFCVGEFYWPEKAICLRPWFHVGFLYIMCILLYIPKTDCVTKQKTTPKWQIQIVNLNKYHA
jgi:hypothetical protein